MLKLSDSLLSMLFLRQTKNLVRELLSRFAPRLFQREWKNIEYFPDDWQKRVAVMADLIPNGTQSIIDYGCGTQVLRDYSKGATYTPVDYISRSTDCVVCDFNKNEFPEIAADVGIISGTLEYVNDPLWFIAKVAGSCETVIISYCTTECIRSRYWRRRMAWVNDLSSFDLVQAFKNCGFTLRRENKNITRNHIFLLSK